MGAQVSKNWQGRPSINRKEERQSLSGAVCTCIESLGTKRSAIELHPQAQENDALDSSLADDGREDVDYQ
jgi:hypothetical protein